MFQRVDREVEGLEMWIVWLEGQEMCRWEGDVGALL